MENWFDTYKTKFEYLNDCSIVDAFQYFDTDGLINFYWKKTKKQKLAKFRLQSDGSLNLFEFIRLYDQLFNEKSESDNLSNEIFVTFYEFYSDKNVTKDNNFKFKNKNTDLYSFIKTSCLEFGDFERFWTKTIKPVSCIMHN